ncbi:MAG: PQQ-dependent sugar dehydrogenase [Actinobacteria bacterium]|nr:PQQ-dependent sugar dehydrogenase [Actinomycetota bacterium]
MVKRSFALVLMALGLLALAPTPASADIESRRVIGNLRAPVAFTFGPGRTIWYVEKNTGRVWIHDLDNDRDRLFVRVPGVNGAGERGVLGIALHPDYPDTALVYLYVTRSAGGQVRNQILRYRDDDGSGVGRRVVFSSIAGGASYHNGGRIAFGPDGMLYAIVGDAHDSSNSQDLSNEDRGKIIRIEPDGDIPSDNPLDGRLYAYGIRNSFGFAFDPETGDLWETENGPGCNDEVNPILPGRNYGWGPSETCNGSAPENTNQDGPNPVLPALLYRSTIGITGIAFCEGCRLGAASEGTALFGAINNGKITRISFNGARDAVTDDTVVLDHGRGTISFEVSRNGRIYFSDFEGIHKLVQVGGGSAGLARRLSRG